MYIYKRSVMEKWQPAALGAREKKSFRVDILHMCIADKMQTTNNAGLVRGCWREGVERGSGVVSSLLLLKCLRWRKCVHQMRCFRQSLSIFGLMLLTFFMDFLNFLFVVLSFSICTKCLAVR